jgi:hypothetical protein
VGAAGRRGTRAAGRRLYVPHLIVVRSARLFPNPTPQGILFNKSNCFSRYDQFGVGVDGDIGIVGNNDYLMLYRDLNK